MSIKLQHCSYDVSLRFIIDDVKNYLEEYILPITLKTETFAGGWCWMICSSRHETSDSGAQSEESEEDTDHGEIGIFLMPPHDGNQESEPLSAAYAISVTSLSGAQTYYNDPSSHHLFTNGIGWGSSSILTTDDLKRFPLLSQENAILIQATFRTPARPNHRHDLPSSLIHRALRSPRTHGVDTCFKVFGSRNNFGSLVQPKHIFSNSEFLEEQCASFEKGKGSIRSSGLTWSFCLLILLALVFKGENSHMIYHQDSTGGTEGAVLATYLDEDSDFEDSDGESDEESPDNHEHSGSEKGNHLDTEIERTGDKTEDSDQPDEIERVSKCSSRTEINEEREQMVEQKGTEEERRDEHGSKQGDEEEEVDRMDLDSSFDRTNTNVKPEEGALKSSNIV